MNNATTMTSVLVLALAASGCANTKTTRALIEQAPAACEDITIPIYFEADVSALTPEGRRVIASEAQRAKGCTVESVRVLGLADAVGEPAANLELSKKRAASVADALGKAGLPAASYDVAAAGAAGAVTASGEVRPVRRRADITLKLSKPK